VRLRDPNLHLALVDEVQRIRTDYSWVEPVLRERYEALGSSKSWSELATNLCDHVPELEQLAASIELSAEELATIEGLTLDGDRDLYSWVYPSWWDFGDHFTIHDLSGIEHCTALDYLLLGQGLVEGASLAPLASLPRLRELHACARCGHRDLEAVLEIRALAKLDVVNIATSSDRARWQAVIAELARRGVATRG
jgi:hypothetical protein